MYLNTPVYILKETLSMLLDITEQVYDILEKEILKKEKNLEKQSKIRDQLNMAAMITDNGIIDIVTGILAVIANPEEAEVTLTANGIIVLDGQGIRKTAVDATEAESPSNLAQAIIQGTQLLIEGGKFAKDMYYSVTKLNKLYSSRK